MYWPALSISTMALRLTSKVALLSAALSLIFSRARLDIACISLPRSFRDSSSVTCWLNGSNSCPSNGCLARAACISARSCPSSSHSTSTEGMCSRSHSFHCSCFRIPLEFWAWMCSKLQATLPVFWYLKRWKGNRWVWPSICLTDSTLKSRSNRLSWLYSTLFS